MSNQVIEVQVKEANDNTDCCVSGCCLAIMMVIVAALACTPFFLF